MMLAIIGKHLDDGRTSRSSDQDEEDEEEEEEETDP